MIDIARYYEESLENLEKMDRETENFLNSEVDADPLEKEKVEQETDDETAIEKMGDLMKDMENKVEIEKGKV